MIKHNYNSKTLYCLKHKLPLRTQYFFAEVDSDLK